MSITVGSVIYLEAFRFLPDFFDSLLKQDIQQFDLFLINDNIPLKKIKDILSGLPIEFVNKITIVDCYEKKMTPNDLRVELFIQAKRKNKKWLLLLDCDDMASVQRIGCFTNALNHALTFLYNELVDMSGNKIFSCLPDITDSYYNIFQANYLGLSNTALNLTKLNEKFFLSLKECECPVFDWYLFSRILIDGHIGRKVSGCYTRYRIHNNNIAGRTILSQKAIEKELEIKKSIYKLLSHYEPDYKRLLNLINTMQFEKTNNETGFWWSLTRVKEEKKDDSNNSR